MSRDRKTWLLLFLLVATSSRGDGPAEPKAVPSEQRVLQEWPLALSAGGPFSVANVRIHVHDAQLLHWLVNDSSLPNSLDAGLDSLPSASAMWLKAPAPQMLLPAATENRDIMYYHGDHLGSTHVMTDRHGNLVQETTYYPFGQKRKAHTPGSLFREPYGFTQKEEDRESDLNYFEARYLAGGLSRFISPDPKFANPSALDEDELSSYLAEPQTANLYSYVRNNPLNHVDPTGLDDEASTAAVSFIAGAALAAERTGVDVLPSGVRETLPLTTREIENIVYPPAKLARVQEASFAGPFLVVARFLAKPFAKTALKEIAKTEAKAGVNAFASTGKVASQGAETLASRGGSLVTRAAPNVAPRAGEFGFRSSAAEIARADKVLEFVRSSNNARLGMDMKEAAAHFNAAVAEALKKFP